jgi:Polyketide cyclase / dehydrase and lipid transport
MTATELLMLNMHSIPTSPANYSKAIMHKMKNVLAALSLAVLMAGCASIQPIKTTTSEGPMRTHEVSITRQAVIPGTPEAVFNFITAEDVLPKVLTGYGPLPAVVKTSENTGPWTLAGSARLIHLADGSTVREQLTHFEPSKRFAYRVWEFGNPLVRTLATGARGEWTFSPAPGGTLVTWTYTFTAKNAVTALPLSGITKILWRGYMDICLKNSKRLMAKS